MSILLAGLVPSVCLHFRYPALLKGVNYLSLQTFLCSERASETNSGGKKLRDGANINRSLLALANCINALGKQQKKGLAYVPYRNRYAFSCHGLMVLWFLLFLYLTVNPFQQIDTDS